MATIPLSRISHRWHIFELPGRNAYPSSQSRVFTQKPFKWFKWLWISRIYHSKNAWIKFFLKFTWRWFWQTEPFAQHMSLTALPGEVEGYIIDLLADLSNNASIELQPIVPVADGQYGRRVGGVWNGMIRELIDNVCESTIPYKIIIIIIIIIITTGFVCTLRICGPKWCESNKWLTDWLSLSSSSPRTSSYCYCPRVGVFFVSLLAL